MGVKRGAGVIPFSIRNGVVYFLFHKTFSGRRAGLHVDFGGGSIVGEPQSRTAAREFVEETEAMFLASSGIDESKTEIEQELQIQQLLSLLQQTQQERPDWWCQRANSNSKHPKDWKTYFVEVEYRALDDMNREWALDTAGKFKKRRELLWVSSDQLLDLYANQPEKLWKRVRQLEDAEKVIRSITQQMQIQWDINRPT